ncbi:MAG: isoprenylcysteine carboxylmethyltransferase family protein [Cyanobacteria bacterium NC_groundwater_1444_Ag_S-0.65um_54_12]|nr:isoprenylcysteine carboxylmethyltransferase family protein [Cyanobacteria bacterium NC_groundwater_1444_Ag_S-0.65um_54_12]
MFFGPNRLILIFWSIFVLIWTIGALRGKPVTRRETTILQASHGLFLAAAFSLLFLRITAVGPLGHYLLPNDEFTLAVGAGLTALGIAFAIWARIVLGGNWSSMVTVKENHQLICTGPYALSRHPIYTGILLAFLGTAIAGGTAGAFLGWLFAIVAFMRKSSIEERWMREHFGDDYDKYARAVRYLLPFVW